MMPCSSENSPTISDSRSAFAEARAVHVLFDGGFDFGGDFDRQFPETQYFLVGGAQERVEYHFLERFDPVFQRNFFIFLEEEGGVRKARVEDPLVAARHHSRIAGARVAHRK